MRDEFASYGFLALAIAGIVLDARWTEKPPLG
jgi:hypothetical protein